MSHEPLQDRRCAQCGKPLPEDRDKRALYCDAKCKRNFHNVSQCRGQEIMALLEAHARHRHAARGTKEYDLQRYARQQAAALLADYRDADRKSGRDASLVVQARMDDGVWVMDKRRRVRKRRDPNVVHNPLPWFMEEKKA